LTTIISLISGCAANDSTAGAIVVSSFRAGTMAETDASGFMGFAGGKSVRTKPRWKGIIMFGERSLKHKVLGPLALMIAAGVLYVFAMPSYRQGEPSLAGRKPQDFALQIPGAAHLSDLRGKVVVLNFWASWCPPCLEEAQSLNHLQKDIASKGGMVLGASWDDDETAYKKYLQDNQVNFPTFIDTSRKIGQDYGTVMIPETYLIDRQGRLARKIVGPQDWQSPEIMQSIDVLLNQN
jgi:cytochrome c biogenesis protein CcmG/thiol:disulfide interchange protein DsbE